jgi:hypothetical protein
MKPFQKFKDRVKPFLTKNSFISNKISALLRIFGADVLGQRISSKSDFIPDIIPVRLPAHVSLEKKFRLYTASGKDQIARNLWSLGWHGFEKPLPDVFSACVHKSSGIVIDVGANTGFYSILAIYSSKRIKVHAFEPYLPVKQLFEKNIRLNRVNHRICAFNDAVSDQIG